MSLRGLCTMSLARLSTITALAMKYLVDVLK